ncbi:hypothetical protein J437_LFUL008151 [Ladona fulva]|uniref:Uncharacterized protein n=1 Tax=Ladona fulva TaxID=123851 RepID=A0A8K0NUV6_LADFU|nr:hypothetical protein J437_LFUL008151 [Ladona fulva]
MESLSLKVVNLPELLLTLKSLLYFNHSFIQILSFLFCFVFFFTTKQATTTAAEASAKHAQGFLFLLQENSLRTNVTLKD